MTTNILVVDDEIEIREIMGAFLSRNGFAVHAAQDGVEALEMIDALSVQIVLSDIRMPRMNGLELARTLLRNRPEIPVILITGTPVDLIEDPVPVHATFCKPCDGKRLLATLEALRGGRTPEPS